MILRNKKTGGIIIPSDYTFASYDDGIRFERKMYYSLAELNEEWEDYKPKEPLLKDYPNEMKAIRAYGLSPLTFHRHVRKGYSTFNYCSHYICFDRVFENLKSGVSYTIAELCGEEEK